MHTMRPRTPTTSPVAVGGESSSVKIFIEAIAVPWYVSDAHPRVNEGNQVMANAESLVLFFFLHAFQKIIKHVEYLGEFIS